MPFRTDIAFECFENQGKTELNGVVVKEKNGITTVDIINEIGAKKLEKEIGRYITCEVPELSDCSDIYDERLKKISDILKSLMPKKFESVMVAGLGNEQITADALGAQTLKYVLSTRHIEGIENNGFGSVCAFPAGVLGETGIESSEMVKGLVKTVKPDVVIVVDALASSDVSRLGTTVQMSDTGITPGSGVGNYRSEISKKTLGIPVISIGIPTVVSTGIFSEKISESEHYVTPREIDTIIQKGAKIIGMSINACVHSRISIKDLFFLLG